MPKIKVSYNLQIKYSLKKNRNNLRSHRQNKTKQKMKTRRSMELLYWEEKDEIKDRCSYSQKRNEYFASVFNKDDASGHKGTEMIVNGHKIYKNGNFSIQGESKTERALMH